MLYSATHERVGRYLESGKAEARIKPWFWIALLLFGRMFKDVSDQWFSFYAVSAS